MIRYFGGICEALVLFLTRTNASIVMYGELKPSTKMSAL
jgi:hypothetical protein